VIALWVLVVVALAPRSTSCRRAQHPAVMALLRDAAWWLPRRLGRVLPPISIEGGDYFAERDKTAAPAPDPPPLPAGT
jgi:RND superfamily putative drug exporter